MIKPAKPLYFVQLLPTGEMIIHNHTIPRRDHS